MVELTTGDLLKADVKALVNTVNCVGVMGKGIALQFKLKFPENFKRYAKACKNGEVQLGTPFIFDRGALFDEGPQYIINFPTKRHWRSPSRLEDIQAGMEALAEAVEARGIQSIAIPPLGCGNGGLDWSDVRPVIEKAMAKVPHARVLLYPPRAAPPVREREVNTSVPNMTRGRALCLRVIELYRAAEYRLSRLEVQKLMYLLQNAGEDLRLDYVAHKYGPYAEALNHVMLRMEGHFIKGYGDRDQRSEITLLDGALDRTEKEIGGDEEALARLEKVRRLIDGFETPYGMELLATTLFLAKQDATVRRSPRRAIERARDWDARKRKLFQPRHVKVAWQRLDQEGWMAKTDSAAASA